MASAVCKHFVKDGSFGVEDCVKRYRALKSSQFIDAVALSGDKTDNIPDVLVTAPYSKIIFDLDRPEAEAMQGFQHRLTNASHQARQLGRDRLKDMNVL
ncbi:hypothetical protein EJB05_26488 [Eragrostis curvula]|uniref:Uncharacterized protein n=1 Tax=Eragrostis curvula TaxID=38414 RepID=A0A5J9UK50_9POAL|nr:hypothetical protein EJB05_26488 [Eragrostis curvula]